MLNQLRTIIDKKSCWFIQRQLSCHTEEFEKIKSIYKTALKESGHFSSTFFNNSNTWNARRNRKNRKVIWFNPPYSQNEKTNFGKLFIKLVRKQFPKNNKYRLIFNLITLKLSYCCTINVGNIIKQHNSKVLTKKNDNNNRKCNCKSKPNCPLNGECLTQCLVYKDTSATSNNSSIYFGISEGEFQTQHNNHRKSFRHRECMNKTELSKHVRNLKNYWFW